MAMDGWLQQPLEELEHDERPRSATDGLCTYFLVRMQHAGLVSMHCGGRTCAGEAGLGLSLFY